MEAFRHEQPGDIELGYSEDRWLRAIGLVDAFGKSRFRVNRLDHAWFVTDGPWLMTEAGVYPYSDESTQLVRYIRQQGLDGTPCVVDIGSGCGHNALTVSADHRIALDSNPRAVRFVKLNELINGTPCTAVVRDIRLGLPESLLPLPSNTLFIGNLPFAISPRHVRLPYQVAGGTTGIGPTLAALRAIKASGVRGRLVLLCNSLGNDQAWHLLQVVKQELHGSVVHWQLLADSKLWRVNGTPIAENPMELTNHLRSRASCSTISKDPRVALKYAELEQRLVADGWTLLGRGVLDVTL